MNKAESSEKIVRAKIVFSTSPAAAEMREMRETFRKDIEFYVPEHVSDVYVLSAAVYNSQNQDMAIAAPQYSSKADEYYKNTASIWSYRDESDLMGKVLTILDSSIEDRERREATKSITKELIYDFMRKVRRNSERIIEANEKEQSAQIKVTDN